MSYLYPSAVFHGLAFHELMSCSYLLLSKAMSSEGAKVVKTPIFIVSTIALILNTLNLFVFVGILDELVSPPSVFNKVYDTLLRVAVFSNQLPVLLNHCVIMIRMSTFEKWRSPKFMTVLLLVVLHLMATVMTMSYGFIVTQRSDFYNHKLYNYFILFSGLGLLLDAIINVVASFFFLHTIGSALEMTRNEMFKEMVFNHDLGRWMLIVGVNLFYVYTCVYTITIGNSNIVATAYHVAPYSNFLVLYTFLEGSYVSAKSMVQRHTMANKTSTNSQMTFSVNGHRSEVNIFSSKA
ncbi:hypothetical protein EDD86DRAFT_212941 [Gorgonomyces haynaldii]|nr:hypothetical protein EDD86DRAFT_212941 [Gorgonomyces haynaldii]